MPSRFIIGFLFLCAGAVPTLAQRWAEVQLPSPYDQGYYLDIYFLPSNPQYGWACDNDSGYVVRTTNGGQTWQGTRATPDGFCHLEYIQFLNTTTGYCSGPCGVFKSTDGGANWNALSITADSVVWGGWFKNDLEGWVTGGGCGRNNFYHTTDGGTTWTRFQDTTIKRSNMADPIWQPDMPAGVLYASGNGTLWKSTNDGASWAVESYTGASSPWQEEISRFGNTFMVACSPNNCVPDVAVGGVRWSHDDGATWNEMATGVDMFGCFLLSTNVAWASGRSGNVWYTSDGGTNWARRDCGLHGKHMDDIFFINDSTGWVGGEGLYHLDKALRTQSDSTLQFTGACPDSTVRDTVWVTNENFVSSPWTIELVGADAWMYRVANVIPKPLPSCQPTPIIVEFKASSPGLHTATMVIRIQDPDTVLSVNLQGQRRTLNAGPVDTLIVFNQKVGVPISRVLEWRATAPPIEAIANIIRESGSDLLSLTAAYPQPINIGAPICQTPISGTLADTGWVSTIFRVTLSPCMRDTLVTVRVYGLSGIIHSVKTLSANLGCAEEDTLRVPINNTGNLELTVYSANLTGMSPEIFSILGMVSAGKQPPWKIQKDESDTLLLLVHPTGKVQQAILQINHDDETTERGNVQPWEVALTITALAQPELEVVPAVIELGVVCANVQVDTLFKLVNHSSFSTGYTIVGATQNITNIPTHTGSIGAGRSVTETFTFAPKGLGRTLDTIWITAPPCGTEVRVVVGATVITNGLEITPNPLVDSVIVGDVLSHALVVKNRSIRAITITSIHTTVPDPELTITFTAPTTVAAGDSIIVPVEWQPSSVRPYVSEYTLETENYCSQLGTLMLHSLSNKVEVTPPDLVYDLGCSAVAKNDSVQVIAKGEAVRFDAPRLTTPSPAFTILSPSTPFTVSQGSPVYVVVAYDPTKQRTASAILELVMTDGSGSFEVPLNGTTTYVNWTVKPDGFLYDELQSCDTPIRSVITIQNNVDAPLIIDVPGGAVAPWLDVQTPTGQPALPRTIAGLSTDTLYVVCYPALLALGTSVTSIPFIDQTCNTRVEVPVSATRRDGALLLTPDPIDAGQVDTGTSVDRVAHIINPTLEPRSILALSVDQQEWTILDNVIGRVLQPGDTLDVRLRFTPASVHVVLATLTMEQAEHCTTTTSITLQGEGVVPGIPPRYTLQLRADEQRVRAGDHVAMPIHWESDISGAGIDSAAFTVEFLSLLYHVDTVRTGNMPDVSISHTYVDGKLTVIVRGLGPSAGKPGTVAIMEGVATPAIPDSTLFTFHNVQVWSAHTVTIVDDPGLLIVDVCGPRNMISLVKPTSVQVAPPHPIQDLLNLQITSPYSERLRIQLVDVQGIVQQDVADVSVGSGSTATSVPTNGLVSGIYIVRVTTSHGGLFTAPVMVLR